MFTLKLQKLGKALGIVLPEQMLSRLHAKEGQQIFAVETATGYTLTTLTPEAQKQVAAGELVLEKYQEVFAKLAKDS
jgi:antitoxin component of MazEF toxin-antitoxin module